MGITMLTISTRLADAPEGTLEFLTKHSEYLSEYSLLASIVRKILWGISYFTSLLLCAVEEVFKKAFKLIDLSDAWTSAGGGDLGSLFLNARFIFLSVLTVSFLVAAIAYIVGRKRPELLRNVVLSLAAISLLNPLITVAKDVLNMSYEEMIEDETASEVIILSNVHDVRYMYHNLWTTDSPNSTRDESSSSHNNLGRAISTNYSGYLGSIDRVTQAYKLIDTDEVINKGYWDWDQMEYLHYKITIGTGDNMVEVKEFFGSNLPDAVSSIIKLPGYYRYSINWLTMILELTVNTVVMVLLAYKAFKIIYDFIFGEIIVVVSAGNVYSNEFLKKAVNKMLMSFFAIIALLFSYKFYVLVTAWINATFGGQISQHLIRVLLTGFAGFVAIDGPQKVIDMLGIDVGLKDSLSAARTALDAYRAGKTASDSTQAGRTRAAYRQKIADRDATTLYNEKHKVPDQEGNRRSDNPQIPESVPGSVQDYATYQPEPDDSGNMQYSLDGGKTWHNAENSEEDVNAPSGQIMFRSAAAGDTKGKGLEYTLDGGKTWHPVNSQTQQIQGSSGGNVRVRSAETNEDKKDYAGKTGSHESAAPRKTSETGGGASREYSNDGGKTWHPVENGKPIPMAEDGVTLIRKAESAPETTKAPDPTTAAPETTKAAETTNAAPERTKTATRNESEAGSSSANEKEETSGIHKEETDPKTTGGRVLPREHAGESKTLTDNNPPRSGDNSAKTENEIPSHTNTSGPHGSTAKTASEKENNNPAYADGPSANGNQHPKSNTEALAPERAFDAADAPENVPQTDARRIAQNDVLDVTKTEQKTDSSKTSVEVLEQGNRIDDAPHTGSAESEADSNNDDPNSISSRINDLTNKILGEDD